MQIAATDAHSSDRGANRLGAAAKLAVSAREPNPGSRRILDVRKDVSGVQFRHVNILDDLIRLWKWLPVEYVVLELLQRCFPAQGRDAAAVTDARGHTSPSREFHPVAM
jgi:hypothetical protein